MYVGAVLDLDCLCNAFDQPPELALDFILGRLSLDVGRRIWLNLGREIVLLEFVGLLLELSKRIDATLFEAKLSGANETFRTVPIVIWDRL